MSMVHCSACGAIIRDGKRFCGACGATAASARPAQVGVAPAPPMAPPTIPAAARSTMGMLERTLNVVSVGGCGAVSLGWLYYSGMADTKPDYKTAAAIVLIPLGLIVLRADIDRVLQPMQRFLKVIPRFVRLGIALGLPFLVANYLYARGFSNFDYILKSVVIAPLLSYVLLRTPAMPRGRA